MGRMEEVRGKLAGRYELIEVIGRGGMGAVYHAQDLVLGRSVAVKVLRESLADQDPTNVVRFEREARAAAALNHPSVVAIYDTGADETARFIVMELIDGRSLERIIREDGPLDPTRAAGIAAEVADALAAAHAAGIIHRDIKPANVMVARDGAVKVLDFGIARAIDATTLIRTSSVVGTAAYMSPEQALGKPADERSDIYSLGCVLYALITGGPPFKGEGAAAILNQHANVAPRPMRSGNGRVSPALNDVVMQMLAKSPGERPQTAARVRDLLTEPRRSARGGPASTAPTRRLGETAATRPLARPSERARWVPIALAAALGAVVLIAAIVLASGGGSGHRTDTSGGRTTPTKAKTGPTTHASTTPTTHASTTPPTTTTTQTPTVAGAASALTALVARDEQAGTIDQPATQQITNGLSDILNSYYMGHTTDATHKLAALQQMTAMLEQHGDITSAAAPSVNQAVAQLGTAIATAPAPAPAAPGGPPGQGNQGGPGGNGGGPPGQAKKHGGDGGD